MITFDQIRGPIERVLLVLLTYGVAKGYISGSEVAGYMTLIIGIMSAFYGWWQNRPMAIMESATQTGARVLTSKENADSTPNPNIVSDIQDLKEVKQ